MCECVRESVCVKKKQVHTHSFFHYSAIDRSFSSVTVKITTRLIAGLWDGYHKLLIQEISCLVIQGSPNIPGTCLPVGCGGGG